jgi:hypothetical protein
MLWRGCQGVFLLGMERHAWGRNGAAGYGKVCPLRRGLFWSGVARDGAGRPGTARMPPRTARLWFGAERRGCYGTERQGESGSVLSWFGLAVVARLCEVRLGTTGRGKSWLGSYGLVRSDGVWIGMGWLLRFGLARRSVLGPDVDRHGVAAEVGYGPVWCVGARCG